VIDNKRDGFQAGYSWGQRLFYNRNGERASLTGTRMSDFVEGDEDRPKGRDTAQDKQKAGLNMVMLIQVPLKQKALPRAMIAEEFAAPSAAAAPKCAKRRSDVENAVIGHGKVEGPFTELAGLDIERDPRFPIRVTVQFYKATSNGAVSADDLKEIADQVARVYDEADYVGSLVVDGCTGRPTEYDGSKVEPLGWWDAFWKRHERNTGQTKQDAHDFFFGWD
jgi:hypothetical protein